jgi:hypothetical protein
MSYEIILSALGVVVAIAYSIKTRNTTSVFIVAIQILSVGFSLIVSPTFGYYTFGTAILLALLYPLITDGVNSLNRKLIWLFLLPILIVFVMGMLNYPGYNYGRLSMLIPLGIFVYSIGNLGNFRFEIGFMILFAIDALIKFIGFFY